MARIGCGAPRSADRNRHGTVATGTFRWLRHGLPRYQVRLHGSRARNWLDAYLIENNESYRSVAHAMVALNGRNPISGDLGNYVFSLFGSSDNRGDTRWFHFCRQKFRWKTRALEQ